MNPVSQGTEIIMVRTMRTIVPCTLQSRIMGEAEDHVSARLYFGIKTAYIDVVSVTQQRKVQYARLSGSSMACHTGNRIWRSYLACATLSGEVGQNGSQGRFRLIVALSYEAALSASLMELTPSQRVFSIGE